MPKFKDEIPRNKGESLEAYQRRVAAHMMDHAMSDVEFTQVQPESGTGEKKLGWQERNEEGRKSMIIKYEERGPEDKTASKGGAEKKG